MRTILISLLLAAALTAQERVLLRIGANGQQEAIPLRPGERTQDVIERLDQQRMQKIQNPTGLDDTLKYFQEESDLSTNFGFTHQDVALQWYLTNCDGFVKEFWWRNYAKGGNIRKASIRAWNIDLRVPSLPLKVMSPYFGYYSDPNDSDQNITPFKPDTGDQWFYKKGMNQYTDSAIYGFDPLGAESRWRKGGVQVMLDSMQWQKISLLDHGETLFVRSGIPFGFTLQNDTKKSDIQNGMVDERLELLSFNVTMMKHSLKFYETGRNDVGGWILRSDYEWGMFVVIEYNADRPPKITTAYVSTTVFAPINKFLFTITDDNPIGGPAGVNDAYFHFKKGTAAAAYDSIPLTKENAYYSIVHPSISLLDTMYWYVTASDVNGNRSATSVRKTYRYGPKRSTLLVNNQQYDPFPVITLPLSLPYDTWSTKKDGVTELSSLFALYKNIIVTDGLQPAYNIYPMLAQWLGSATPQDQHHLFFSSQNYGCFILANCGDTTFAPDDWEYRYLGIAALGPQDIPPTNRPMRLLPQADTVTRYLKQFEQDSAVTLWLDPISELGFPSYPDALTPRAAASALFKEAKDLRTLGVIYREASFTTLFVSFDDRAMQFRSDTSVVFSVDPGYHWIGSVKFLSSAFFESLLTEVGDGTTSEPSVFTLRQNYPNPFNPVTTIEYSLATQGEVMISIYNTLGQTVATIVNETKDAGSHRAEWNASQVASGIYFYELRAGSFRSVKKMVLLR